MVGLNGQTNLAPSHRAARVGAAGSCATTQQSTHNSSKRTAIPRTPTGVSAEETSLINKRILKSRFTKRLDLSLPASASSIDNNAAIASVVAGSTTSSSSSSSSSAAAAGGGGDSHNRNHQHHHQQVQPFGCFNFFPRQVITMEINGQHLRELWLTNHQINGIPSDIKHFANLQVLALGGNNLTTLPQEIAQLKQLRRLFLDKNQFRALPNAVQLPFGLLELRLDHNEFQFVPLQVTKCRLLNRLGITYNQLNGLPKEFRRLRNLIELDLDYNQIGTDFPNELQPLERLERLGLEGNIIGSVPSWVATSLPRLCVLRLAANRIPGYQVTDPNASVAQTHASGHLRRRHDGYWQLTHGFREKKNLKQSNSTSPALLPGVLPCKDWNLRNSLARYAA